MPRFRKKPVVIDAFCLVHGDKFADWPEWAKRELAHDVDGMRVSRDGSEERRIVAHGNHVKIRTLEGEMRADFGDYIIRGVQGEIYPCKPDIFEQTYEPVQEDQ